MQFARATSAAALFLLFGTAVVVYAQHDQQNEKQARTEGQKGKPEPGAGPTARPSGARQQPQQEQRAQQRQEQRQERPPQQAQPQRAQQPQRQQTRREQQQPNQPQDRQRAPGPQPQRAQQPQYQQPPQQPHRTQQQSAEWQQQRGWAQRGGWQGQNTWQKDRAQHWASDHRTWAQRGGYGGYYIPQDRFSFYFGIGHGFRLRSVPTIYMGYPRFQYGGYSFLFVDPWPEYWADNWYATDDVYIDYDDGYYLYNRSYPYVRLALTVVR